ncbi:hypothetical protein PC121_g4510 [Phytophthora cactorum]|nr:hypothetical protein PC121_g4510 [Phytophthora cactorum]
MSSQKGKLAIVTGANCGIGFEAAKALALCRDHVVLACRSEVRGRQAEEPIRQVLYQAGENVGGLEFTLLDPKIDSIREFARAFQAKFDHLDLLINNCGVACPHNSKGLECTFAINHLGHFYRRTKTQARVVNVSSGLHHAANLTSGTLKMATEKELCERVCKKQACAIQFCLQRRNYQESKCAEVIKRYYDCCAAAKEAEQKTRTTSS